MSLDSFRLPERSNDACARVPRRPHDDYSQDYLGTQRAPSQADEMGAVAVVDLVFGGRAVIYATGDKAMRRVEMRR